MKRYLVLIVPLLSGCGSSQTIQPGGSTIITTTGGVSYDLTSTCDNGQPQVASQTVEQTVSVTMPTTIVALEGESYIGRADLTLGTEFCSYKSDGQGVYVRQDGSCNSFTPNSAVTLKAGDGVSLALEGCPSGPVSVEASVSGVSN